jgi:RNA polymerase sigma-70 factor, ECF subfamily
MPEVEPDSTRTQKLLEQIEAGDCQALDQLLTRYQPELLAFVNRRLDPKVRARINSSDVVQEAQLEAVRRIGDYLKRRPMPFHLWLRRTAYQRLLNLHRDHRRRARRSVDREVGLPDETSAQLARPFIARDSSPSARILAREQAEQISAAVAKLSEADREILLMRHVEHLPYEAIACLLDIAPATARQRYGRAMIRLQRVLCEVELLEQ